MRHSTKRRALLALAGLVATLGIGIPAAAAQATGISGTVTAEDTGQPLSGVCVNAWTADAFAESACTDDAGFYQFGALTDGVDYFLQVDRFGTYLGEWAFDKRTLETADPVTAPATWTSS
ncbi:MAG: carboxypeptidase-like regulatory domain-containing protein [Sporichthyaceae bacterium]|nr:carboxypeptidase-like regulatory domain-containing protein [Sporichthyaceae bacterium]